mgnify:CR=1 FL=1
MRKHRKEKRNRRRLLAVVSDFCRSVHRLRPGDGGNTG